MKRVLTSVIIAMMLVVTGGCGKKSDADPYASMSAKKIYNQALTQLSKKDYQDSVTTFEGLNSHYPFGYYGEKGQLDVIYAYYMNQDNVSALAAADSYTRLYPRNPQVVYAYYMKGLINMDRDDSWVTKQFKVSSSERDLTFIHQAFDDFAIVVNQFPKSEYAYDAHYRMVYIRNLIATHELETSRYYYQRKVYVAAANRAAYVVSYFQGAPAVIPALVILYQSNMKLNLPNKAKQTLTILTRSYPKATETQQLLASISKKAKA